MSQLLRRCFLYERYLNEVEAVFHPEAFAYTQADECRKLGIFFGHRVHPSMAARYRCVCFVCHRITSKRSGWNEHLFPRRAAHRTTGKFGSQSKFNRIPVCRGDRRLAIARPGGRLTGVHGEEGLVDIEQGLLLALGQRRVGEDRELHRATDAVVGADDPGADVELLGRDPQRLRDLLEHLR